MMEKLNRFEKLSTEGAYLTTETIVYSDDNILGNIAQGVLLKEKKQEIFSCVRFIKCIDEMLQIRINNIFGNVYRESNDGYVIEADEEIRICAASTRGLIYGAYTLQQIAKNGYVRKGIIYNTPLCSFRGLKVYLPAEENIGFLKKFIDMACYYRYNTIIMEVGGAMEYKRHPEINEGWVEYCKEMYEYSGKAIKVQCGYAWEKNSIHCDNGGGSWLSQEKVGMMVEYCKERGLDVIPEVPCLSHCDYMLTRHPELAERSEDPYPDTYCPSNPLSYDLLFDILAEVIEVFKPQTVHVGHDEFYSFGLCEKCNGKDAADIFADDLIKIHKYLAGRGIETMIWGDKLLNFIDKKGVSWGGAARAICDSGGNFKQFIPPTYKAIGRLPENIKIMNWYWSFNREYDKDYLNHRFHMVYGNLEGPAIPEWRKRISEGVMGASISNWSALCEDYMQRNAIFFNMAYCCSMMWKDGYNESVYQSLVEEVFHDLFLYKNREVLVGPHIEITHWTTLKREFEWFFDGKFIETENDHLGDYIIEFEDGLAVTIPVIYGINISNCERNWDIKISKQFDIYEFDRSLLEVSYTTLPVRDEEKTYFKIVVGNPYPNKKITQIGFYPKKGMKEIVVIQTAKWGHPFTASNREFVVPKDF